MQSPCGTRDAESQSGTEYPLSPKVTGLTTGERGDTETVTPRSARAIGKGPLQDGTSPVAYST